MRRSFTTKETYFGLVQEDLPKDKVDMLKMIEAAYDKINEIELKKAKEQAKDLPAGSTVKVPLHNLGDSVKVTEIGHQGQVRDEYTATRLTN